MDDKKVCKQCGAIKPLTAFHRTSFNKSGRMAKCIVCHSFNCHLYYLENQQRCKDNSWTYYQLNKEKHMACCKRWSQKNKWIFSYFSHKKKAKERNQRFDLKAKDVKELFKSPKRCAVTGKRLKYNKRVAGPDSPCMCRKTFTMGYNRESVQLLSHSETAKRAAQYNRERNKRD